VAISDELAEQKVNELTLIYLSVVLTNYYSTLDDQVIEAMQIITAQEGETPFLRLGNDAAFGGGILVRMLAAANLYFI
jgi:hypothetical protein